MDVLKSIWAKYKQLLQGRGCLATGILVMIPVLLVCCVSSAAFGAVSSGLRSVGMLPTYTPTPMPTNTPRPTNTPTLTETPSPTSTPEPTDTPGPTNTPVPTNTRMSTPTESATSIPTNTATAAPTHTAIPSLAPTSAPPPKPTEPRCAFVGSRESDKYHDPSCRWAKKILPENRICWGSRAEAEAAGYVPCGVCKP